MEGVGLTLNFKKLVSAVIIEQNCYGLYNLLLIVLLTINVLYCNFTMCVFCVLLTTYTV